MSARTIAPALRELLHGFIDYAGLFPPAKLPLGEALENFRRYGKSEHAWLLRSFVVPAADLPSVPPSFDGFLSVLSNESLTPASEARAVSIESNAPFTAGLAVYCELAPDKPELLDAVKQAGCYAKIRTGGLKPESIPTPQSVASFINACAERSLPFKATAGLHHAVRALYPLSYEAGAEQALMHGFLNVLMAAAFSFHGEREIAPLLAETDPGAFSFDDRAAWRDRFLSIDEIGKARREFIHSVGSCSFEEPVADLQKLGLL